MVVSPSTEIEYLVVLNDEQQYSIWPAFKDIPQGWTEEGFRGPKDRCLEHIGKVWVDMRPLSLRKKMEIRQSEIQKLLKEYKNQEKATPPVSKTVSFLSNGTHPVRIHKRQSEPDAFKKALSRGSIHVVFTDTVGETCLRIDFEPLELEGSALSKNILLRGFLELDFCSMECIAEIDLKSMEGTGYLTKKGE